jgi:hypothetical protein
MSSSQGKNLWHLDMEEAEEAEEDHNDISIEEKYSWWHCVTKLFGCCSGSDYAEL